MTKLQFYLRSRGITQAVFADRLGVGRGYVTHICNGRRTPSLPVALKIEELTEGTVRPRDLVSDSIRWEPKQRLQPEFSGD